MPGSNKIKMPSLPLLTTHRPPPPTHHPLPPTRRRRRHQHHQHHHRHRRDAADAQDNMRSALDAREYDIIFEQRPGRTDGCLTAWRRSKLRLVSRRVLHFNQLATGEDAGRFRRDNISLITTFAMLDGVASVASVAVEDGGGGGGDSNSSVGGSDLVVVANLHFYWNPNREDVKLAQAVLLGQTLEKLMAELNGGGDCGAECDEGEDGAGGVAGPAANRTLSGAASDGGGSAARVAAADHGGHGDG